MDRHIYIEGHVRLEARVEHRDGAASVVVRRLDTVPDPLNDETTGRWLLDIVGKAACESPYVEVRFPQL